MTLFPSRKIYTVSEITAEVKWRLEAQFSDVLVEGEISNFTAAASGHLYFVLKDKSSQIKCVCFRNKARLFRFKAEDGLQVIVGGNLSVYEPRGEYQIYVEFMEPKGLGSLQLAFEQLKARLQTEGLFDALHKKALPLLPRCVGIVTSPTGAAIQDILRTLRRRHKSLQVLIYPARVQGEGAAQEIAAGIHYLNTMADVDVMIVGRGGGSLEDLWAFNEEGLARAIYASRIPVISAVGHEVDFTIADFVADLRAPTPSAAAEMVISKKSEMVEQVANLERRLSQSLHFQLSQMRNRVFELSSNRVFASVEGKLGYYRQRLDELVLRQHNNLQSHMAQLRNRWQLLSSALHRFDLRQIVFLKRKTLTNLGDQAQSRMRFLLQTQKARATALGEALKALSPLAVLDRGYSICRDSNGNILKEAQLILPGDRFSVKLSKGSIDGRVEEIHGPE